MVVVGAAGFGVVPSVVVVGATTAVPVVAGFGAVFAVASTGIVFSGTVVPTPTGVSGAPSTVLEAVDNGFQLKATVPGVKSATPLSVNKVYPVTPFF